MQLRNVLLGVLCPLVVVATTVPAAAVAAPTVRVTTKTYAVYGSTERAIRRSMDQRGPGDYDARTDWYVNWSYTTRMRSGRCRVASRTVSTRIAYLYPRWIVPASASADLRANWTRYIGRLRVHERGHGRIGLATGARIDATLRAASGTTCAALGRAIRTRVARHFRIGNAADVAYDRRTRHGETQGAVFP